MKTKYFTPENINQEAQNFINALPQPLRDRKLTYRPRGSVLLVLDMQLYFLEPSSHAFIPSAVATVPALKQLAQSYFTLNLPVIFTQHLNSEQDAGSMSRWWQDLITIEDPSSAIIPEFDFSNRFVLPKSQYDAFYQTDLEKILRNKNVSQVVISGVMTHLCCETTARSAFMRGFDVFFLVDGTATFNEQYHLATLRNLSHGFATPMFSKEIQTQLDDPSGA